MFIQTRCNKSKPIYVSFIVSSIRIARMRWSMKMTSLAIWKQFISQRYCIFVRLYKPNNKERDKTYSFLNEWGYGKVPIVQQRPWSALGSTYSIYCSTSGVSRGLWWILASTRSAQGSMEAHRNLATWPSFQEKKKIDIHVAFSVSTGFNHYQ